MDTKTYEEKDAERTPVEWDGDSTIMLGTLSGAGTYRRMDGSLCTPKNPRPADPWKVEAFALTRQWEFVKPEHAGTVVRPMTDQRYTIGIEFCGHPDARYVARFCGEWIGQSRHYSAAVMLAADNRMLRNGAEPITEEAS